MILYEKNALQLRPVRETVIILQAASKQELHSFDIEQIMTENGAGNIYVTDQTRSKL